MLNSVLKKSDEKNKNSKIILKYARRIIIKSMCSPVKS